MASVGKHIRRLRAKTGLTQEQLAERLFVTRQAVSAWETGKALPDLTMLESIAAALGADVTEVIYGRSAGTPDLRPQKRKWLALGALLAAAIALFLFALEQNGVFGTMKYGLRYQFWNQAYEVAFEELPGRYSMELDLTDLKSNLGKVLYEDEAGCRIVLTDLLPCSGLGLYELTFDAQGVCTPRGGQMVSGCHNLRKEKMTYSTRLTAAMYTRIDGVRLPDSRAYTQSSLMDENNNFFGFHLFPPDFEGEVPDTVTITLRGLTRMTTTRVESLFG